MVDVTEAARVGLFVEAFGQRRRLLRQLYADHPWTKAARLHLLADAAFGLVWRRRHV